MTVTVSIGIGKASARNLTSLLDIHNKYYRSSKGCTYAAVPDTRCEPILYVILIDYLYIPHFSSHHGKIEAEMKYANTRIGSLAPCREPGAVSSASRTGKDATGRRVRVFRVLRVLRVVGYCVRWMMLDARSLLSRISS